MTSNAVKQGINKILKLFQLVFIKTKEKQKANNVSNAFKKTAKCFYFALKILFFNDFALISTADPELIFL